MKAKGIHTIIEESTEYGQLNETRFIALLQAEIDKCLPEKHVCDDSCNIRSNEWEIGHRAYKDAESNVIDDVRHRLREFIQND